MTVTVWPVGDGRRTVEPEIHLNGTLRLENLPQEEIFARLGRFLGVLTRCSTPAVHTADIASEPGYCATRNGVSAMATSRTPLCTRKRGHSSSRLSTWQHAKVTQIDEEPRRPHKIWPARTTATHFLT
ncbi:unnamed protein product [Cercospora beticola]|nr:unnamed protein product [Cercospora beticola]